MPDFLLHHRHALCTCLSARHEIWWWVEAGDPQPALALLPDFVAERTDPVYVREVDIP